MALIKKGVNPGFVMGSAIKMVNQHIIMYTSFRISAVDTFLIGSFPTFFLLKFKIISKFAIRWYV